MAGCVLKMTVNIYILTGLCYFGAALSTHEDELAAFVKATKAIHHAAEVDAPDISSGNQKQLKLPENLAAAITKEKANNPELLLQPKTEGQPPTSKRKATFEKDRMSMIAKGIVPEENGIKSKKVIPAELLEEFTEDELLDRIQMGKNGGGRYTLRDLGVTSVKDYIKNEEDDEHEEEVKEQAPQESWEVLMRASSGSRFVNLMQLWQSDMTVNECNNKLRANHSNVKGVYKSSLANHWDKIHEVRLSIFNKGELVFRMTFDASRSTKTDWFSEKWVTSHPFKDLGHEPLDVFSIAGVHSNKGVKSYSRRLYVAKDHGGCGEEETWMMVADTDHGSGYCEFERDVDLPAFYYSPKRTAVHGKDMKQGDVLMIEGKVKYNPSIAGNGPHNIHQMDRGSSNTFNDKG